MLEQQNMNYSHFLVIDWRFQFRCLDDIFQIWQDPTKSHTPSTIQNCGDVPNDNSKDIFLNGTI